MKIKLIVFALIVFISNSLCQDNKISDIHIDEYENSFFGKLYITTKLNEYSIADSVVKAWIISNGENVVYSKTDGAGGFENEGQSLRLYNLATKKEKLLTREEYAIESVKEVKLKNGKNILIVKMYDGGLGGQYIGIINPAKGKVYLGILAKVLSLKGDFIELGFYKNEDAWGSDENTNKVKPYKKKKYDLKKLADLKNLKIER